MTYDFEGKVVYLSGPMTGRPDWNRDEFARVTAALLQRGAARVHNPAHSAPVNGERPKGHEHYMLEALRRLTEYVVREGHEHEPWFDALVLLDGWPDSDGSIAERVVAEACGIDVVEWRKCE